MGEGGGAREAVNKMGSPPSGQMLTAFLYFNSRTFSWHCGTQQNLQNRKTNKLMKYQLGKCSTSVVALCTNFYCTNRMIELFHCENFKKTVFTGKLNCFDMLRPQKRVGGGGSSVEKMTAVVHNHHNNNNKKTSIQ